MTYKKYIYTTRVFYDDTDATGFVYHAHYLRMAERARTSMLYEAGFDHTTLKNTIEGAFVVKEAAINYIKPAKLDDRITVQTNVLELGGASVKVLQEIWKENHLLASIMIKLAFISLKGRPLRFPLSLKEALSLYSLDF